MKLRRNFFIGVAITTIGLSLCFAFVGFLVSKKLKSFNASGTTKDASDFSAEN